TSPFTGGALLGDRIRMQDHFLDDRVFIRSMGTRGSLGGLARNTKDAVKALDAFGFDWIIVETVGVGQAELDIIDISDSTMVVLTPGAGDSIQTIKAGIMEIADIFVVNKCDLPGAHKVASEIDQMLEQQDEYTEWRIPVIQVSAQDNQGIDELMFLLKKHKTHLQGSKFFASKREERTKKEILDIVNNRWQRLVEFQINQRTLDGILGNVADKSMDPYTAAEKIIKEVIASFDKESFIWPDK
ncbi:MAG: methylmalonyl Co-A mutase-associated GTPase MeaB, partial [Peptococcaceae bacterium]|nr:methylmalonyl Co-A mutase-associated GTPase MeaB [Peptococcaceae bacterium]